VFDVDPIALAEGKPVVTQALEWAVPRLGEEPVLISSTATPEHVRAAQDWLGRDRTGSLIEAALAAIARGLVERGVPRLVVAGGETAGAVVQALGVTGLRIGPQIDPGVPWTMSLTEPVVALALKIRQLRAGGLLCEGVHMSRLNETALREEICRLGASIFARGLTFGSSGNISVRLDDGWLMTPTNASMGRLDPARLAKLDASGRLVSGDPPTKEGLLHLCLLLYVDCRLAERLERCRKDRHFRDVCFLPH
jgi:hypothetical protein